MCVYLLGSEYMRGGNVSTVYKQPEQPPANALLVKTKATN